MKPVAIIVQRWHSEIAGGSEQEAGLYARYLSEAGIAVDLITTTAKDSVTWANHYPPGIEERPEFRVIRFSVAAKSGTYHKELHAMLLREAVAVRSEPAGEVSDFFQSTPVEYPPRIRWSQSLQEEWIRAQGPHSPDLISYLIANRENYSCFIFMTYLFAPTYFGASCVPSGRTLFVPTLHDEPPAYLPVFANMARRVAGLLWNTTAEQELGNALWGPFSDSIVQTRGGMGIDCPEANPAALAELPGFSSPRLADDHFALYCGRINGAKGGASMIDWYLAGLHAAHDDDADYPRRLILTGDLQMELPNDPAIVYAGFVTESQKFALMSAADVFIMPSEFESLSVVTLEAMGQGTPILGNIRSAVIQDHIIQSKVGRLYHDRESFARNLAELIGASRGDRGELAQAARSYVAENYSHAKVRQRVVDAVRRVMDQ